MNSDSETGKLTHLNKAGEASMVDVGDKSVTRREARASTSVTMRAEVLASLSGGTLAKGDALAAARIAGIQAAKRTAEWIPLCHSLPLDWVQIDFEVRGGNCLAILCSVRTTARTGVEMEALIGASAAALTIYDMAKSADRGMVIGPTQLEYKSGGKSGTFQRGEPA